MQEKIKEISSRIHELRELSEISVEEIAKYLNIPVETYQQYDTGETDIPASILFEIAQFLKVDMTLLLTGEEPRMHIFTVTRKDKGPTVERRKAYQYQNLGPNFIHKKAETFLVEVEAGSTDAENSMNSHPGQEFDFVLEGTLKVRIHDNEIVLEEGDSIYFDSSYGHAMEALGDKPAKFLAMII
ncbi:cupin domain-containing protein [Methanococcoides sp. NM1]|uniref:cupin domain-containing protein n=1 Tax=Methanococcoides sp. NM1 TaxID=1201013 RepID=UPI0010845D7C|nr:cupin domain-containing protein [Methanococcoides sp. NM1]